MKRYEIEVHVRTDKTNIGDHRQIMVSVEANSDMEAVDKALDMLRPFLGERILDFEAFDPS